MHLHASVFLIAIINLSIIDEKTRKMNTKHSFKSRKAKKSARKGGSVRNTHTATAKRGANMHFCYHFESIFDQMYSIQISFVVSNVFAAICVSPPQCNVDAVAATFEVALIFGCWLMQT